MPCPAQWKRRRRQAVRLNGSCSCYPSVEPRFSARGEERSPSPKPGAVERAPTPARAPRRVTGAGGEPTGRLCTGSRVADRSDGKAPLLGSHAHAGVPIPLRLQPPAPVALLRVLFLQPSTGVRPAMPPHFLQPWNHGPPCHPFLCPAATPGLPVSPDPPSSGLFLPLGFCNPDCLSSDAHETLGTESDRRRRSVTTAPAVRSARRPARNLPSVDSATLSLSEYSSNASHVPST